MRKRAGTPLSGKSLKRSRRLAAESVGEPGGPIDEEGSSTDGAAGPTTVPTPTRTTRPRAEDAVRQVPAGDLPELVRFWSGERTPTLNGGEQEVRKSVLEWMRDVRVLQPRVDGLSKRLANLLDAHLHAPRYTCTRTDLVDNKELAYLSAYDLEAGISALSRHGLLALVEVADASEPTAKATAVPQDLGDAILRLRRAQHRGIFDAFTLRGHLDRLYEDPARAARTPAGRVRELYKMYSNEQASVTRIERLPDGLRQLVEKTVLEFGGLLPRSLFDRMDSNLPRWNAREWGKALEDSLVGTVARLELAAHGIQHSDETLIVFNEVALAWLRHVAVPGDPDKPHDEAGLGVDLVANISRVLAFILDHDVRFTVRGEIFKTTEKRILQELIPNPGRELEREEVLQFIYAFCRAKRLIESTGERTFALTRAGREWESLKLQVKLRALIDYAIEERGVGGEPYHQIRMRRLYLRLVKRVEPGLWYDLMYVPFLTRNTYLASLDDEEVEEHFASRSQAGQSAPREDLQRMAWNLVSWVRKRLYLFGLIDLGYDKAGRPVAMRLTRSGAKLLGMACAEEGAERTVGSLVVTPDFDVVLFPTGDDAELVHDLDRFCQREKVGSLFQFRLAEKSVLRALTQGMALAEIVRTLEENSRTPVPENVLITVQDWATRAGLLFLNSDHVVRSDNAEVLSRFAQDPGVKAYVLRRLDDQRVKLKSETTIPELVEVLRGLDYLVEHLEDSGKR